MEHQVRDYYQLNLVLNDFKRLGPVFAADILKHVLIAFQKVF